MNTNGGRVKNKIDKSAPGQFEVKVDVGALMFSLALAGIGYFFMRTLF